jgi:TatD DNase family protein
MKYIDIHCHLDREDYGLDFEEVLARMKEKEVAAIAIGADLESSKKAVEIAEQNENILACIGVHPECVFETSLNIREVETNSPGELSEFEKLIKSPKVVGIGECGLDYFRLDLAFAKATTDKQKKLFESQIQFAIKHDKPLMLHIREAYDDALEILQSYKKEAGEKLRGNVHFFAGSVETAKKFLDLGFTMSFTGVITFTHDYDEVIKYIPQNSIMSETDAPFVAPIPFRGKRNEPVYVIEVIKKLAEIRGEDFDILNQAILTNAKRVFAFLG